MRSIARRRTGLVRFGGFVKRLLLVAVLVLPGVAVRGVEAQGRPERALVPDSVPLSESAQKAIAAAWLTEAERHALRVFHGAWDLRDLTTPALRAAVALNAWDFENPVWGEPGVPAELAAELSLLSGEFDQSLELLKEARSNAAARIRAEALEGLGRVDEANAAVDVPVKQLLERRLNDASELTEGVRAMFIRARIQGQPARDFQTMMDLLAKARQEIDALYWPSRLAEAELLLDKDNPREGVGALHEALSLNPRASEAWYQLGKVALDQFDFGGVVRAEAALRRLNRRHPLADLLVAGMALVQDDPETALQVIDPLLKRLPKLRPALALRAAAEAILYDDAAMRGALDAYDKLSPGSALAYFEAGRHLSMNRQYESAAAVLEEAVKRRPSWPAPRIELGLMEMQSGRDDRALGALEGVVKLDPFNKRAAYSLFLLQQLTNYKEIESEHFIVRYAPGVDEVMAEMMPAQLEKIHAIVGGRFKFEPSRKTLIEVHPDHERFAVRITGMPFVHTIAACTGPVIAMEVPREGAPSKHFGLFDWPRVIQHEYTHTITLGQTRNRIPHWLTEGAAVSMEPAPRDWEVQVSLAEAWKNRTLFSLDEIKWAFVRPKKPGDRGLAYAQGHWMVQYMNERYGSDALISLLARYDRGEREQQAIPDTFKISREQFFHDFVEWAGDQVKSWGLAATPSVAELSDELRADDPQLSSVMEASRKARLEVIIRALTEQIGQPDANGGDARDKSARPKGLTADEWPALVRPPVDISDEQLAKWMERYPDHPDLIELGLRRRLEQLGERFGPADTAVIEMLEHYARLRPGDPYPHKRLAQMWLASATPDKAVEHLEFLDAREDKLPAYAVELAQIYRKRGDLDKALAKVTRVTMMNPYQASNRELAATIALEKKDYVTARLHIAALTKLEPDRPQHAKRLEAIDKLLAAAPK